MSNSLGFLCLLGKIRKSSQSLGIGELLDRVLQPDHTMVGTVPAHMHTFITLPKPDITSLDIKPPLAILVPGLWQTNPIIPVRIGTQTPTSILGQQEEMLLRKFLWRMLLTWTKRTATANVLNRHGYSAPPHSQPPPTPSLHRCSWEVLKSWTPWADSCVWSFPGVTNRSIKCFVTILRKQTWISSPDMSSIYLETASWAQKSRKQKTALNKPRTDMPKLEY